MRRYKSIGNHERWLTRPDRCSPTSTGKQPRYDRQMRRFERWERLAVERLGAYVASGSVMDDAPERAAREASTAWVRRALPPRAFACLLAAVAVSGCAPEKSSEKASPSTFDAEHSTFTPETIETYSAAPLYWLGPHFERWGISTILGPRRARHRCRRADPTRARHRAGRNGTLPLVA
jgi:hypothetical protein